MIYVIATTVLKEGCREKFIELAKANLANVRAEKGCISYVLNDDCETDLPAAKRPGTLTFVECWESLDALKAHLAAPHMKAFAAAAKDLRTGSELRVVTPVI